MNTIFGEYFFLKIVNLFLLSILQKDVALAPTAMESILHENCSFFLAKKSDPRSSFLALEKHNFGQNLGMKGGK
jgi:hypothetical protein